MSVGSFGRISAGNYVQLCAPMHVSKMNVLAVQVWSSHLCMVFRGGTSEVAPTAAAAAAAPAGVLPEFGCRNIAWL